jgi:hypothetical protein
MGTPESPDLHFSTGWTKAIKFLGDIVKLPHRRQTPILSHAKGDGAQIRGHPAPDITDGAGGKSRPIEWVGGSGRLRRAMRPGKEKRADALHASPK